MKKIIRIDTYYDDGTLTSEMNKILTYEWQWYHKGANSYTLSASYYTEKPSTDYVKFKPSKRLRKEA